MFHIQLFHINNTLLSKYFPTCKLQIWRGKPRSAKIELTMLLVF